MKDGSALMAPLVKNPPALQNTPRLIPGLGRSPGEGKGYPLQYSGLENSTDCIVHGVAKSWTRLSNYGGSLKIKNTANISFCNPTPRRIYLEKTLI